MTRLRLVLSIALMCAGWPGDARAQQTSGIAGIVRDASGAVLPGVTVEAASPVLIEKVRTVVTDGEGRYNVVDLRPGTYVVTFTLPGFNTFRREGIDLTAGFTATVNGDMQVGSLDETITVTGAAPLVDTQNVRQQAVLRHEVMDVLPSSTKSANLLATLTPGVSLYAETVDRRVDMGFVHGKAGTRIQFDGMGIQNMTATGSSAYMINSATVEEMTIQTSGISAESSADGAVVNMIPKEGGNTFAGTLSGMYAGERLQSDNLDDALRARGLTTGNDLIKSYDTTFTLGGPIKRDRLWFFAVLREWGNRNSVAGVYWNKTQSTPFYTPDLDRPADRYQWYESFASRVTWQASSRNKFNFFADVQDTCQCRTVSALGNDPASAGQYHFRPQGLYQAAWSAPLTSRLLLEAGSAIVISHWPQFMAPGVQAADIAILEQSTNFRYNAAPTYLAPRNHDRFGQRFSMSYVTGSHNFKTGFQIEEGIRDVRTEVHGDVNYRFNNGIPNQITQYATPYLQKDRMKADLGIYAQDQWTINRLTLNAGLRYDYFNGYVPPQHVPAPLSGWVPERNFPAVHGVPAWHDLSPRIGAAYDLFGTGRTALKMSMGRYVGKTAMALAGANNPLEASANIVNRSWNDVDRDYVPDCDLGNFGSNGECGPVSDVNFGQPRVTTRYADEVLRGFGVRDFNWDISTEVQHEIVAGMSIAVGYYHNWFNNFLATDNLALTPSDFDPFCITAPADQRLPGGGGYQVCGLYNIKPEKFGQSDNQVSHSSNFGNQAQVNDFFSVIVNGRLASGLRFGGGVDTGRSVLDRCFVIDSPQELLNCRVVTPFSAQTQVKLNASYPLPYGFGASAVLQNLPGPQILADYAASTAEIAPSLGRNLAGGSRNVTVPLIAPQTEFEGRITRLDLRLSKQLRLTSALRMQVNADVYNALNGNAILTLNTAYGQQWLRPTAIVEGRMFQFSGQLSF